MNRLQPTRTLTSSRLVTITSTYETDLTQAEFLSLTLADSLRIGLLGDSEPVNLDSVAIQIVEDYGDLFTAIATCIPDLNRDLRGILEITNGFDYQRFDKLMLSQFNHETGYTVLDGNRRSVALALLLKTGQIAYQPVTAVYTEIHQSIAEPILDTHALSQTIAEAQKGMRHYPVNRK